MLLVASVSPFTSPTSYRSMGDDAKLSPSAFPLYHIRSQKSRGTEGFFARAKMEDKPTNRPETQGLLGQSIRIAIPYQPSPFGGLTIICLALSIQKETE